MSSFWHWYITIGVIVYIIAVFWLLQATRKSKTGSEGEDELMDHSYDGIQEYNNPLPRWWLQLFYITLIFSIGYLVLYPGLGSWKGTFGWTQQNQFEKEVAATDAITAPIFKKFGAMSMEELVSSQPQAIDMGKRMFINSCSVCHGSDAGGAPGFPNLTDNDWLWGGDPDTIQATITLGRTGSMPAWASTLDELSIQQLTSYVISLSGRSSNKELAEAGQPKFQMYCSGCHGADAKGAQALGAANLTDKVWLYGGSAAVISKTIREGRSGIMPAHKDLLSADQIHLVGAYVYSLSHTK